MCIKIFFALFSVNTANFRCIGIEVVPSYLYQLGYTNMGLMVLAPGAFIILGLIVWAHRIFAGIEEE